jgi:hypothetical protein
MAEAAAIACPTAPNYFLEDLGDAPPEIVSDAQRRRSHGPGALGLE